MPFRIHCADEVKYFVHALGQFSLHRGTEDDVVGWHVVLVLKMQGLWPVHVEGDIAYSVVKQTVIAHEH